MRWWDPRDTTQATSLFKNLLRPGRAVPRHADRSRRTAEVFEGVSHDADTDGYGVLRPFGTTRTDAWRWKSKKKWGLW